MDKAQRIHDSVRKSNYREAYELALDLEKETGEVQFPSWLARSLASLTSLLFIFLGREGLKLSALIIRSIIPSKKINWVNTHAILWGVYWQDMRKSLRYNLFVMAYATDETKLFEAAAFTFYTDSFFGNLLSLSAMNKLVTSEKFKKYSFKQSNLLVWLGVANQMSGRVSACLKAHSLFITSNKLDPFQVLISKASVLNMSISDIGPAEAEIALEDCFRVACSLDNSRNHIQLYGVKSILLALEGDLHSAQSFYGKAKHATLANSNTLDWIIFSRLSCIYFLTTQDWRQFDIWHLEMKIKLESYGPVSWYWQEYRRLHVVSTYKRSNNKISAKVINSAFNGLRVFQPIFFGKAVKTMASVLLSRAAYWSKETLLKYYKQINAPNLKSPVNDRFNSIILSIGSLVSDNLDNDLHCAIRNIGQRIGSDTVIIDKDIESLVQRASRELEFNPNNSLTKGNNGSLRFFIDNKGFFVVHAITPASGMSPFAFGMLFRVLDVHTLEAHDLISNLLVQHLTAIEAVKQNAELLAQSKILSEKAELAAQVSHDIRSPLSAINLISDLLVEIPEEKRSILRHASQRINDIANQLLTKSKQSRSVAGPAKAAEMPEIELLSSLIDSLISEKRMQFRDKLGVSINVNLQDSYGVFAHINSIELKRVLSNLINNSVEALIADKGSVDIRVQQAQDLAVVTIKDNGQGVPAHILEKLGQASGVSYGKEGTESGSGLGIYHAKKTLEAIGGQLSIESVVGQGTTLTLTLKRAAPPAWFIDKIRVSEGQTIVCLDDDVSIHQIWSGRVQELVSLGSENALNTWLSTNGNKAHNTLFLMDYELLGQPLTGLDIIEKFSLQKNAILVTSRFENSNIRKRCASLGIKIIPKSLAGIVPIDWVV